MCASDAESKRGVGTQRHRRIPFKLLAVELCMMLHHVMWLRTIHCCYTSLHVMALCALRPAHPCCQNLFISLKQMLPQVLTHNERMTHGLLARWHGTSIGNTSNYHKKIKAGQTAACHVNVVKNCNPLACRYSGLASLAAGRPRFTRSPAWCRHNSIRAVQCASCAKSACGSPVYAADAAVTLTATGNCKQTGCTTCGTLCHHSTSRWKTVGACAALFARGLSLRHDKCMRTRQMTVGECCTRCQIMPVGDTCLYKAYVTCPSGALPTAMMREFAT